MLRQGAESFRVLRTETTVSLQAEGDNEPSSKKQVVWRIRSSKKRNSQMKKLNKVLWSLIEKCFGICFEQLAQEEDGGLDGTRTRDPRRDRPVF